MALAPLSQTVVLTEDGSTVELTEQVVIPPRNTTPPSPPIIATPAAIQSDESPQVGETFTLVRPTGNGPVVAERLLENGVDVFSQVNDLKFTGRVAGTLRYEADLQGPNGDIAISFSTITVAGATINNTPPDSSLPYTSVSGAPAAFDALGTTADDQDDRLTQLEAA